MTDRRREPHILNAHTPTFIGGSRCTVICKCGWSTHDYLDSRGPWLEYRQHKKEILKPRTPRAGLQTSQENP